MGSASRVAPVTVTRIADGMYRVEHEGQQEIVYVAGRGTDRWVFWKGRVFRRDQSAGSEAGPRKIRPASSKGAAAESYTAPMPARVSRILVQPGARVRKGDTLVVLEAMKMELPIRALADASVTAVHCREGDLVQADAVLIDLK